MYGLLVALHNITRWLVLVSAVYALYVAYSGWFGKKTFDSNSRRAGVIFGAVTGIQFLLGLLVYFWPGGLVMGTLGNEGMGGAMRNEQLRFFVVEHISVMIVAIALIHIGNGASRRAPSDVGKFRRAAIFYTIGTLIIVFSIPWWRPLFPGLG